MSLRNGKLSPCVNGKVRFLKDYQIINISCDDDTRTPESNNASEAILGKKKILDRCESIGTEYRRIACTHIEYEDELLLATMDNDLKKCQDLISKGADVNKLEGKFGVSALHVAAKMNFVDILMFLLSEGADINLRSKDGPTPLHIAIRQKSDESCFELLNHSGVNIFLEDNEKHKCLPLHLASKMGNYQICKRLLELDSTLKTVNKKDKNNRTPLHEAAAKGFREILVLFLEHNADWDVKERKSYFPIHLAAQNGHWECCLELLEKESDLQPRKLTKDGSTALMLAAKSGNHKSCEILKDYCDINAQNASQDTALHYAAIRGFHNTVGRLLEWGAEVLVNAKGNSPLHETAGQKSISSLVLLTEKIGSRDPGNNELNQNVLHIAAQKLAYESLRYLLEKDSFRAKVNEVDRSHRTPLLYAVRKGDSEIARILLENCADPFIRDSDQNLPLHIAAAKNLRGICDLLTRNENRKSINFTNKESATPLHLAAVKDARSCCSLLVDKGAAMDVKDKYGNAPIHLAVKLGHANTLSFFIKKGIALTHTVESTGDTSLHLASSHGHMECSKLLLKSSKKSIDMLNKMKKSPLDSAIDNEHDDIFECLLLARSDLDEKEKIEPKYTKDLQKTLHQYMHMALESKRVTILRSLVLSKMWSVCFNPLLCKEKFCPNFNNLIIYHPELAKIVFDKCTNKQKKEFNFELFDVQLFINGDGTNPSENYPFNRKTGKLLETAKEREHYHLMREHPLRKAINSEHLNLLVHPLTNAYLKYKWVSYVRDIFFLLLLFEFLSVIVFSLNIGFSWNYSQLDIPRESYGNICSILRDKVTHKEGIIQRNVMSAIQIFFLLFHIILETKFLFEMKRSYFIATPCETTCKILRCVGIFCFILPCQFCPDNSLDLGVKMIWQWQAGILTLLLCWALLIHKMNQLPVISVFMPVTRKFAMSFAKVIFYIFLIIFIFAYIFYLLLDNEPAFDDIPNSFIKTVVWMLGDLNYDSAFVENQSKIRYPVMTNLIFLFFVTSISFFIINMVITNPSDHLDVFRDKAAIHKASSRIMLFLKLDSVFVETRKRFSRSFVPERETARAANAKVILNFIDQIDSKHPLTEQEKLYKNVETLNKNVQYLIQENNKLLNYCTEMAKLREQDQEKMRKDFESLNEKLSQCREK